MQQVLQSASYSTFQSAALVQKHDSEEYLQVMDKEMEKRIEEEERRGIEQSRRTGYSNIGLRVSNNLSLMCLETWRGFGTHVRGEWGQIRGDL